MASGKALDLAWVLYSGEEMLWHQRRVVGRMAPTHGNESEVYGVVSPDGGVQVEDYSGTHEDIAAVRYASSRTDVPAGVVGCLLYKFEEDIPGDDMVIYRRTAVLVCEEEWVERMPGQTAAVYMSHITTAPGA